MESIWKFEEFLDIIKAGTARQLHLERLFSAYHLFVCSVAKMIKRYHICMELALHNKKPISLEGVRMEFIPCGPI